PFGLIDWPGRVEIELGLVAGSLNWGGKTADGTGLIGEGGCIAISVGELKIPGGEGQAGGATAAGEVAPKAPTGTADCSAGCGAKFDQGAGAIGAGLVMTASVGGMEVAGSAGEGGMGMLLSTAG